MCTTTILATCYAVNPYKGSEDAMGWNFICQIARYRKVIAITRENNQAEIEKYMSENPDYLYQNIQFLYFDLPYWIRFWKKGSRGALLYYYLWQRSVVQFVKKKNLAFDIIHNVNFHNDWTPTFLWKLKKPLVWGPVGHHPKIPKSFLRNYSLRYYFKDRLTYLVKKVFWNYSYSLKKAKLHAAHIWCMNSSVAGAMNLSQSNFSIYPSVATEDFANSAFFEKNEFKVLSIGRFVPLKGFDLSIYSFAKFLHKLPEAQRSSCQLVLVGKGKEKALYLKMIQKFNLEKQVQIIDWMDRNELMKLYQEASIFLFPSHEGAGMVIAEALSFGLPILCLNNSGPGELIDSSCGVSIASSSYEQATTELCNALHTLHTNENVREKMSRSARRLFEEKYTWNSRGNHLNEIYKKIESCAS